MNITSSSGSEEEELQAILIAIKRTVKPAITEINQ